MADCIVKAILPIVLVIVAGTPAALADDLTGKWAIEKNGVKSTMSFNANGAWRVDYGPIVMYGRVMRNASFSKGTYKTAGKVLSITDEIDGIIRCIYEIAPGYVKIDNCDLAGVYFKD